MQIQHAQDYVTGARGVNVVSEKSADKMIKAIDAQRHGWIADVAELPDSDQCKESWRQIFEALIRATNFSVDQPIGLRAGVIRAFVANCPDKGFVFRLQVETGTLPKPARYGDPSPLGNTTMQDARQKGEARKRDRATRDRLQCKGGK